MAKKPKYQISQESLSDFVSTIDARPQLSKEEIFSKFPEFKNDDTMLSSAMDYYETSKSGKYKDVSELNSKFPEFSIVEKKKTSQQYHLPGELDVSRPFSSQLPGGSGNVSEQPLVTAPPIEPAEDQLIDDEVQAAPPTALEDAQLAQLQKDTDEGNFGIKNPFVPELIEKPLISPVPENLKDETAKQVVKSFQEEITGKREDDGFSEAFVKDLAQVPPSFNKGVISAAAALPKGVGILAQKLDELTGATPKPIEEYVTYQLGDWIDKKAAEIGITAIDDKRAGFINNTVPMAFGQMMGMILMGGPRGAAVDEVAINAPKGILGKAGSTLSSPMAVSGALQASVPEFEAAKQAGLSDDEAFSVFFKNIPGGLTEVVPIANMFSRLNKLTNNGVINAIKSGAASSIEEASQEAFQQFLTNKIAQGTYDPARDLSEGVGEGAGAGAIVGLFMPGIISAMQNMTTEDKAKTEEWLKNRLQKDVGVPTKTEEPTTPIKNEKPQEQPAEPAKEGQVATSGKIETEETLPVQGDQKEPATKDVDQKTGSIIPRPSNELAPNDVSENSSIKEQPAKPPSVESTDSFEQKHGKKSLLGRAFEGSKEKTKEAIEKYGLSYEPESFVHAKENAEAFIEEVGFEQALDAIRKSQVEDGAAAFVWSGLIDRVGDDIANASDEDRQALIDFEAELIEEFDRKARSSGRFISALQDVYENSDFGYKLSVQIQKYKNHNKGEIPKDVEEKFNELDKQLTEAKKARVEAEERAKKAEDELALSNIRESIEREKKASTKTQQKIREARSERSKLKSEFLSLYNPAKSSGRAQASVIPGAVLVEYGVRIANTYIKEGVARVEEIIAKTREYFSKELNHQVSDGDADLIRARVDKILDDLDEKEGRVRISQRMIRDLVEGGVKDINELVSKIKENVKERHPDVTDREIRDAITGYGKTVNPNRDEVETSIRKMIRIGRVISALEDIAEKKKPLKSGKQRDKLDAEERALNKELKSAMAEFPVDEETETDQLKTSLDAVKTRLKNQIEEYNLAIETGKKSAKSRGIDYDEEAKKLADERDQIKEIYDAIFYKHDDDATKIETVLKSTEKAIERVIKRIEDNDLEGRKRGTVTSPEIKEAKDRLNRLRDRLTQLQEEAGIPDRKRLESAKNRANKRLDDLKERLETRNFAKKPRPDPIIRDSELLRIDAEIARLKESFDKEMYKVELKNRTKYQKAVDALIEIWGLTRVLRATGEFSFVLIQNWVYTQSHPITAFNAIKTAFSHFASEKKSDAFLNHIRAQEYYSRLKASKLAISETDVKLTAREEMFIGSWGNKLWDILGYPLSPWKPAYEKWKKLNPLKAFERAGTGFMNTVRVTRYLEGEEMLRAEGKSFKDNPEDYKNVADVVNTLTGRASIGSLERISKPLAVVFFSPRNWASIVKQTTPYAFYHFGKMGSKGDAWYKPSVAQKMAMSDYIKAIGMTTSFVMLIAYGMDEEEKEKHGISIEFDPRSSDFMKIKLGKTRIDPWGGRQSMIVLQARLIMNSLKDGSGKIKKLGEKDAGTGVELMANIARNKLSPSASLAYKFADRHVKRIGNKYVWVDKYGNELYPDPESNLYPIYAETIRELYAEQPDTIAHLITFLSFWGVGSQTYDKLDQKKKKIEFYKRVYSEK